MILVNQETQPNQPNRPDLEVLAGQSYTIICPKNNPFRSAKQRHHLEIQNEIDHVETQLHQHHQAIEMSLNPETWGNCTGKHGNPWKPMRKRWLMSTKNLASRNDGNSHQPGVELSDWEVPPGANAMTRIPTRNTIELTRKRKNDTMFAQSLSLIYVRYHMVYSSPVYMADLDNLDMAVLQPRKSYRSAQ